MSQHKTHRAIKKPEIKARFLADYMAASEKRRRTIVRDCKYRPIARLLQHDEAKLAVGKFIRSRARDNAVLQDKAQQLRDRLADSNFERTLYDANADYIARFSSVHPSLAFPIAEIMNPKKVPPVTLNGVKVTIEICFSLQRVTKTNKVRIGAAMLRYAKGMNLSIATAKWQSALLFGCLRQEITDPTINPEQKLCITIDAYSGKCHAAPSDAVRRFGNMAAACASISERWDNVTPPATAIF